MFTTLFIKEIRESVVTVRFILVSLICVVLIPLGIFVSLKEYEQRLDNYHQAVRLYTERAEGNIGSSFTAEGYRSPSPLGVFSSGLKHLLPYQVTTSRNGYTIDSQPSDTNSGTVLFGDIDFVFIVGTVLSILALIFSFSTITGEREQGTLRLMLSNPVSKGTVLVTKILGNFTVFLAPFIVSILVSLILLGLSSTFHLTSADILIPLCLIIALSVVFLLSMFTLGTTVSIMARTSGTSMTAILFVWVVLILAVPAVSPLVAQAVHPIVSQNVIDTRTEMIRDSLGDELDARKRELFAQIITRYGIDTTQITMNNFSDVLRPEAMKDFDSEVVPIEEEYRQRISSEVAEIQSRHEIETHTQSAIAVMLSRLSPKSCFMYIVSELAGTGKTEAKNFHTFAARFQDQVQQDVYRRYTPMMYGIPDGLAYMGMNKDDDFDEKTAPVPQFSGYRHVSLETALEAEWVDIVLLLLYTLLFFAAGFVQFIRYDVR
jgi:ABC-type transport system involved in multi-copper enzyme maturation permease subunit